jgi:acetylornithine deacetylase/succinyl-diaminopimelate desuccinylase-like protein
VSEAPADPSASPTGVDFASFDRVVEARLERWTQELVDVLAIASEGGDAAGLRRAADWTADRLRRLGATVEVLQVGDAPPLVVGEIGHGPRTVTAVQHYDVQPAAPLDLWTTPPYEPAIRDGRVWARGATDNKGELLPRIWAVEAWLEAIGPLPCRVRYLVEGQEETGSGALDAMLDLRPHLREADAALIEGGFLDMRGRPGVVAGGKGIVVLDLSLRTMRVDSHSSVAALLPNAGQRMIGALATFWGADGRPAVAGLDTGVRPPTDAQRAVVATLDLRELDDLREHQGIDRFTAGVEGVAAAEVMTFEPTLNLQGLWSGHTDTVTPKTVIPAEAYARIDIRIVPDQQPADVIDALRRHLDEHGFGDVEIGVREGEPAWWTPPDHPVVLAAGAAAEDVTGQPATYSVSMPGTVPMYQVCAANRVPVASLGAARDDADAHAPDENIRIEDLATATRITGRFLDRFARLPEVPKVP